MLLLKPSIGYLKLKIPTKALRRIEPVIYTNMYLYWHLDVIKTKVWRLGIPSLEKKYNWGNYISWSSKIYMHSTTLLIICIYARLCCFVCPANNLRKTSPKRSPNFFTHAIYLNLTQAIFAVLFEKFFDGVSVIGSSHILLVL